MLLRTMTTSLVTTAGNAIVDHVTSSVAVCLITVSFLLCYRELSHLSYD